MPQIGKNISRLRKLKKITQKNFAKVADINYRHFQDIEGDKADIRISTALQIAEKLDVPVSAIFRKNLNLDLIRAGIDSSDEILVKLPVGICITDENGRITFANTFFFKELTYHTEESLINNLFVWDLLPEEGKQGARKYVEGIQKNLPKPIPGEHFYVGPGKNLIKVRVHWDYLRYEDGRLRGFISTIIPISE